MKRMSHKKKFILTAVMAGLAFVMSSCSGTNGWNAYPIDNPEGCYQIEQWESNGAGNTKTWGLGVYCPLEIADE